MKKILLILLSVIMSMSVCSCEGGETLVSQSGTEQIETEYEKYDSIEELKALRDELKNYRSYGEFVYLDAVTSGETSLLEKRLDMDTVTDIIENSKDQTEISDKIQLLQPFPDFKFKTHDKEAVEYWFDDKGYERILIDTSADPSKKSSVSYEAYKDIYVVHTYVLLFYDGKSMLEFDVESLPVTESGDHSGQMPDAERMVELTELRNILAGKGTLPYLDAVISGKIPELNGRIDIQTVKNVIKDKKTGDEICNELGRMQQYPDTSWTASGLYGGGVSYWSDDMGYREISVNRTGVTPELRTAIYYRIYDEQGVNISYECLFYYDEILFDQ